MALPKILPPASGSAIKTAIASKTNKNSAIESFLGEMFQYRDMAHLAHLSTTSYAAHMALNDLYDGLLDQIDALFETAQTDGLLNVTIPSSSTSASGPEVAKAILDCVNSNRPNFPHSFQQQILDNIEELASKTIYKLKFLN